MLIAGGSALSIAMICLIASRLNVTEPETSRPTAVTTTPAVSVSISTTLEPTDTDTEPEIVITINTSSATSDRTEPIEIDSEPENYIDIDQSFTEATKPTEPPTPPVIEDESALTNPDVQPEYKPEQTTVTSATKPPATDTPQHGDTKDGFIYINGFGWVADEGGGGEGSVNNEMYENGNKIGTFG